MPADDQKMLWQETPPGGYPPPTWLGASGLERLRAGREGRLPITPMSYLTEMNFRELSRGHVGFQMPASPWFANSAGVIGGGVLATIADACLGAPIHSDVPPGVAFTTAELSLTLLRPVHPAEDRLIVGSGHVIHRGRSIALSEAFLFTETEGEDAEPELVAHGTSRCSVFPPMDPIPDHPGEMPVIDQPLPGDDPSHPLRREVRGEALPQKVWEERSGLEVMKAQAAGELEPMPPIYYLTGLRPTAAGEGEVTMVLPCSQWLSTGMRTVQGGFTAMLAEFSLAAAALTTAEAGTAIAPLDLKVNYLRPVFPDGHDLTAHAKVEHRGRTLCISSCRITNAGGKEVALATGSSMYLPGRPASLAGVDQLSSAQDAASWSEGRSP